MAKASRIMCILAQIASVTYILLDLAFQEVNLGSLGVAILVITVCLAGLSKDEARKPKVRTIHLLFLALIMLISSLFTSILPYVLLIVYPLAIYLSIDGDPYTLLVSVVLLFTIVKIFSANLFLFGIDTTHHTARVMKIMVEGRLTPIEFVDRRYQFLPFYHIYSAIFSEITNIQPAFPFISSFLTYGILGLIVAPYLISRTIGESSLVTGLLLTGLPLAFVLVVSPIPEAYSLVLCLIFFSLFLKPHYRGNIIALLLLSASSFFYHPVPTFIFILISILLSLRPHAPQGRNSRISLLLTFVVLLGILSYSYLIGLLSIFLSLVERIRLSTIRDILALRIVSYSVDLSSPINSFLMLVDYTLIAALAVISLRNRKQILTFLFSLTLILLSLIFSFAFYTASFYRYFGTPTLFLLAILAGQGLRRISYKRYWKFLTPILIVIFTSSSVIGALIPPGRPLSQDTAYLFKGIPREPDVMTSSFVGRYASGIIFTDYRIEPAVKYYTAIYGSKLKIGSFSPRKNGFKALSKIIEGRTTFLRKNSLIEMKIIGLRDLRDLDHFILEKGICYSSGRDFITLP